MFEVTLKYLATLSAEGKPNVLKDNRVITLPAATTALILIDLQKGLLGLSTAPHSMAEVLTKGMMLAKCFRAAGAPVVLVNVAFSAGFGDVLKTPVDKAPQARAGAGTPDFSELANGLAEPSDLRVTKRQCGAFYGTDLDLQLRRRGVTNVVLGGVATNIGVESTARAAHEHGYGVVLAEDAITGHTVEMHGFAFEHIFPRLGRAAKADAIKLQG
jgi:nicotinamidase-related amidase